MKNSPRRYRTNSAFVLSRRMIIFCRCVRASSYNCCFMLLLYQLCSINAVELICLSICTPDCLSFSLYGRPCSFLENIYTDHNFLLQLWPQTTGSNTLSVSIIFLSIRLAVRPWYFFFFCNYINFQCEGLALRCFYLYTRVHRTPVGSNRGYMSVHAFPIFPSVSLYIHLSYASFFCHIL